MKHIIFSIVIFHFIIIGNAQDKIIFYNANWKKVDQSEGVYFSLVNKVDSLWLRQDYYSNNRKLQETGYYEDSSTKIKVGLHTYYHPNGIPKHLLNYTNNIINGSSVEYYSNGMIMDSTNYIYGVPVNICSKWYPSGNPKLEMRLDSMREGSGIVIGWFDNGVVSFKGRLEHGFRKIGPWTYYHENGNKASVVNYPKTNGELLYNSTEIKYDKFESFSYDSSIKYISKICYDENGIEQNACEIVNSDALYYKNTNFWHQYLEGKVTTILRGFYLQGSPIIYTLYFSIGAGGQADYVLLDNDGNVDLDRNIKNLIKFSHNWTPAINNNRKVPTDFLQRIVIMSSGF